MDAFSFTDVALLVIFVWLLLLTFLLFKVRGKWHKISEGKSINFVQILEGMLSKQESTNKSLLKVAQEINNLSSLTKSSFQKSALMRFNPFEDTGGDQSFIIALLDGNNSGFVISSLHSRNGTRVYSKQITNGKAANHELSKEEKEIVEKAIKG